MLLSEQFDKDTIGSLLIETKSRTVKQEDKKNILRVITGRDSTLISECIKISLLGENIVSFNFPESQHEVAEYIIESCDDLGYKVMANITDKDINIRVIRNAIG